MTMVATTCPACNHWNTPGSAYCELCGATLGQGDFPYGPPRVISIGREPENTFVIPKTTVSGFHAQLDITPDSRLILRDLGSMNRTFVNSPDTPITVAEVLPSDLIYFGRLPIPVYEVLARQIPASKPVFRTPEQVPVQMNSSRMVFGRDPACDYPLPHPMVSFRHAVLYRTSDNRYFIEDLQSRNGTWVDGKRIEPNKRTEIRIERDEISFGSYSFKLTGTGTIEGRETGREIRVIARDIGVAVPSESGGLRKILEGASLTIEPGDLVALMGPSGAGKTTLLTALNGMVTPVEGQILYQRGNSQPVDLRQYYDQIRPLIGYVPQDDIMHPQLTVREALFYTAKLRLPHDYTDQQIEQRIQTVLSSIGLWEEFDPEQPDRRLLQNTVIGDATRRGISGGQRKRVNLAMELLSEPTLLFLDEPTSGLSALDSQKVIELLRKLADGGCTIVVTIHQPSIEVYQMFKLLAMVSNHPRVKGGNRETGRLVYFGPAMKAFDFFGCAGGSTGGAPQHIEESLVKKPVDYWVKTYQISILSKHYGSDRGSPGKAAGVDLPAVKRDHLGQFVTLAGRYAKLKLRDTTQTALALGLPIVFGALVAMSQRLKVAKDATPPCSISPGALCDNMGVWSEVVSNVGTLEFLMVIAAFWFGCNNAIREVVGERVIYRRERMVNLSIFAYLGSKYVVLGALALVQCLLMLLIAHFGAETQASFAVTLTTLFLTCVTGTGLGLCLSAALPTSEAAIASLPLVLLPMIVLGGGMTPLPKLDAKSHVLRGIADVAIPTRWAFEANMLEESRARNLHGTNGGLFKAQMQREMQEQARERSRAQVETSSSPVRPQPVAVTQTAEDSSANTEASESKRPDLADQLFPAGVAGASPGIRRHTYAKCMEFLGIFASLFAMFAAFTLKLDEIPAWKQVLREMGYIWRKFGPVGQFLVVGLAVGLFVAAAVLPN
jgi:ABC-type multidrug transport system ATPase subunit